MSSASACSLPAHTRLRQGGPHWYNTHHAPASKLLEQDARPITVRILCRLQSPLVIMQRVVRVRGQRSLDNGQA